MRWILQFRSWVTTRWPEGTLGGWLDGWSAMHFLEWFGGWFLFETIGDMDLLAAAASALGIGIAWELHERTHPWDAEPFVNRWISDLAVDTLGGLAGWLLARTLFG